MKFLTISIPNRGNGKQAKIFRSNKASKKESGSEVPKHLMNGT